MGVSSSCNLTPDMSPETRESLRAELVAKCEAILKDHPENRCCKYTVAYLNSDEGNVMSNEGEF